MWLSHKAAHHLTHMFSDGSKLMQVGEGKAEVFSEVLARDLGKDWPMHMQLGS